MKLPIGTWIEWYDYGTWKDEVAQITSYNGQYYRAKRSDGLYASIAEYETTELTKGEVIKKVLNR